MLAQISTRRCLSSVGAALLLLALTAKATRLVDLVDIEGDRINQLIGYGLVVGLQGTGDQTQQTRFTSQSMINMLRQFGVQMPAGKEPKMKNVAAVSVNADLGTYTRLGQRIDVTVSSIGDAKSLRGGVLLASPLKGLDGHVYAVAQGSVVVPGVSAIGATGTSVSINTTTVGRIPSGAVVEKEVFPDELLSQPFINLNLKEHSYSQARKVVKAINDFFGRDTAIGIDGKQIRVKLPGYNDKMTFIAMLENLQMDVVEKPARVVINARSGTIVIGSNVSVRPVAVSHGATTVKVFEQPEVSQPTAFSATGSTETVNQSAVEIKEKAGGMFMVPGTTTLDDIVNVVNSISSSPIELISIIQAIHQAGAIDAELVML